MTNDSFWKQHSTFLNYTIQLNQPELFIIIMFNKFKTIQ